jgi:hypothetical protein
VLGGRRGRGTAWSQKRPGQVMRGRAHQKGYSSNGQIHRIEHGKERRLLGYTLGLSALAVEADTKLG